ncbi:MAG: hypothetical protein DBX47_03745 [Clostridiales bacterium]|nr:MAG: hypothetical protein DBX47_03745 [Clostridiales bacterium]
MLDKIIDSNVSNMIKDLSRLIKIPSVSQTQSEGFIYGENVNKALDEAVKIAQELGFEARNLGRLTEVSFGKGDKKVYIACHMDVVPAGSGWTKDPFYLTEEDGKLFGRGVLDNKGSAIAVLYALKALKDAGYTPNVSLKLLLGGAEETGMDDLPWYMQEFGYPDCGLTPDSVFPIVNTEAGMFSAKMKFKKSNNILSFNGGTVSNAVPAHAEAKVIINGEEKIFSEEGKNAHASVPWDGVNAIINLAKRLNAEGVKDNLINILCEYFSDNYAEKLGLASCGEILGHTTLNVGVIDSEKGYFTIDMRLACDNQREKVTNRFESLASEYGLKLEVEKAVDYTHVSPESIFMKELSSAFSEITGKKAEFLGSCGLTYAKALGKNGVAFGPVYNEEGCECGGLHGSDEFVTTEVLVNLQKIYAKTILKLWC